MRQALLLLALLASGCVVHERVPPPPPASPPPPPAAPPSPPPSARAPMPQGPIDERGAVRAASDFARGRGLIVERYKAKLDGHGNWRVELRSDRGHDKAKVLVDGRTGRVLRAKLHESDSWDD